MCVCSRVFFAVFGEANRRWAPVLSLIVVTKRARKAVHCAVKEGVEGPDKGSSLGEVVAHGIDMTLRDVAMPHGANEAERSLKPPMAAPSVRSWNALQPTCCRDGRLRAHKTGRPPTPPGWSTPWWPLGQSAGPATIGGRVPSQVGGFWRSSPADVGRPPLARGRSSVTHARRPTVDLDRLKTGVRKCGGPTVARRAKDGTSREWGGGSATRPASVRRVLGNEIGSRLMNCRDAREGHCSIWSDLVLGIDP
jgi:hypothetical protein